jgi:hypothetical protein
MGLYYRGERELRQREVNVSAREVTLRNRDAKLQELINAVQEARVDYNQAREEWLREREVNVSAREVTLRNREAKLNEGMKSTEAVCVDAGKKEENSTEKRVEDKQAGEPEGMAGKHKATCLGDDTRGEGGSSASALAPEERVDDKKAGEGRAGKRKAACQDDDMRAH